MESIIKKLYYGSLNPDEWIIKKEPEYQKLNEQIVILLDKLKQLTNQEIFENISELMEITTETNSLETAHSFSFGFKYGAIMMMEILKNEKE
ncbi:hypothetical protein acsn021_19970 [Anaerocolumna cellulosilytica]|uniref:Uncharacterized protein n=1 Tax=Anaerocolumna cellulosilytica TaxID=433286 RepID=A0A6S6R5W8_9FIRM|nr:DUF6809 family protein [Anaerocolumna cellulosilytica]MBB5196450.1 hypothetical protein [Anaerocolumna cellulosilytica]BCJ94428.1 hypothetical protein acsn021_19970 [Anaerocolumna cellulosilytica]